MVSGKEAKDGWEIPIGLTADAAIDIDSDSEDPNSDLHKKNNTADDDNVHGEDPSAHLVSSSIISKGDSTTIQSSSDDSFVPIGNDEGGTNDNILQGTATDEHLLTTNEDAATTKASELLLLEEHQDTNDDSPTPPTSTSMRSSSSNPFEAFAFNGGSLSPSFSSTIKQTPTSQCWFSKNRKKDEEKVQNQTQTSNKQNKINTIDKSQSSIPNKATNKKRKRNQSKQKEQERISVPFEQMTPEEQTKCKFKWQSFADEDAPIDIKRFQVMIAARLHCQAHEPVVRKAMTSLKEMYRSSPSPPSCCSETVNETNNNDDDNVVTLVQTAEENQESSTKKYLSAETLSKANPEDLSKNILSSVLFANVKAKQIVKAANEILSPRFGGKVPETLCGLKEITGIGPKLAQILWNVNSYAAYSCENK